MSPPEDRGPVAVRAAPREDVADHWRAAQIADDCAEGPTPTWRMAWFFVASSLFVGARTIRRATLPPWWALDRSFDVAFLAAIPLALAVVVRGGVADRVRAVLRKRGVATSPPVAALAGEASARIGLGLGFARGFLLVVAAIVGPAILGRAVGVPANLQREFKFVGAAVVMGTVAVAAAWKGRMTVSWPRPPVCGDASSRFHLSVSDGGARIDELRCVLVCVRRRTSRFGFEHSWEAIGAGPEPAETTAWVGPGSDVVIDVAVPADLPPSDPPDAPDPVVWKLRVSGMRGTAPFVARFEVPVLAAAAAGEAGTPVR